jgi:hypothetical protein
MQKLLFSLLALRCFAGAPDVWVGGGASSKRICAGIKKNCDGVQTCIYHAFGPCGGLSEPTMYVEAHVEAYLALRGSDTYLEDASQIRAFSPSSAEGNGYRRYFVSTNDNSKFLRESVNADSADGGRYAFMQAGAFYGADPSVSGSWLGVSSYLLTEGNVTTRTKGFILPSEPGQPREEVNSVDVCISDHRNRPVPFPGSCGAARTFRSGELKFSLLGSTWGSEFSPRADETIFGIRTRLDLVGTDTKSVILNDDKTLESIGSTGVTKLVLKEAASGRELTIEFPPSYNLGDANPEGFMNPNDTKVVQVKVSKVQGEVESVYLDYLFEMPRTSGKYLIYSPRVLDSTGVTIFESFSLYTIDPIPVSIGFCMVIYFICCNFFFCAPSSAQNKFFET